MKIEPSPVFAPWCAHLPQQSEAALQRRRRWLIALGAGTFTGGLAGELTGGSAAHAQSSGPPARIGFVVASRTAGNAARLAAFKQGMREIGLIEGKHYVLDPVYAEGRYERFPALIKELLQREPAVIVTTTIASVRAAQQATRTVPIVMAGTNDPVGSGLVASLARPGGNTTGLSTQGEDTAAKLVEFVREVLPRAKRIALLINPDNPSHAKLGGQVRTAASKFGIEAPTFETPTPAAFDAAFATIAKQRPDALMTLRDAMLSAEHQRISEFALKNRIAAFGPDVEFAASGSFLSYGASATDMSRRSATYVKKILSGTKPADLPVEQPVKFEMVLNLKTAKALGIKIPYALLIQAERVIE